MKYVEKATQEAQKMYADTTMMIYKYSSTEPPLVKWFEEYITPVFEESSFSLGVTKGSLLGWIVMIHFNETHTFKQLTFALTSLEALGWSIINEISIFEGLAKEYAFSKLAEDPALNKPYNLYLTMRVWVPSNSQNCIKVKVGTQDKFELQCRG